jgi:hypothetical protein
MVRANQGLCATKHIFHVSLTKNRSVDIDLVRVQPHLSAAEPSERNILNDSIARISKGLKAEPWN